MGRQTRDTAERVPLFSSSWDEGRFWDNWMVVHFLSGTTVALSNVFLKLSPVSLWLLALVLMIAWEVVEMVAGVREQLENRALDLVAGLLGVFVATTLANRLVARAPWVALAVSALLLAIGCFLGWRAYRRRMRASKR